MLTTNQKKVILTFSIFVIIIFSTFIFFLNFNLSSKKKYYDSDPSEIELNYQGSIDDGNYEIFWFIHVTDTQFIWYNDEKIHQWETLLNETFKEIKPLFIYNTGDLVNSDYEHFMTANERNQRIEEWESYRETLDNNKMNYTIYMDVVGNHDCYGDSGNKYFLKYSMMGRSKDTLQYAFKRSFSFGKYSFIGLHTADNYGVQYPFALFGYLNKEELNWYEDTLENSKDCERIFLFGHQPPLEIYSDFNSNGKTFLNLNKKYNVFAYFCGHGHINSFQNVNGLLAIETCNFDEDGGTYRIVSVDQNQLSTSIENVGKWPQGIITYPPREQYINDNLDKNNIQKIRVLAWDPKGVNSVEWCAYKKNGNKKILDWKDLENATNDGPLWEGNWNSNLNDGKDYTIKVRIKGGSGEQIKELNFSTKKSLYIGLFQLIPLFYISFFALISIIIISTYHLRTNVPKFKKKPEQKVDKQLKKLYLLKCLIFLTIPLTFAGMFLGKITAVFSLFYLNSYGIHFMAVNLMFTALLFLFTILWIGFRLSYKKRKILTIDLILSISFTCFLITFYLLHFPTISWFSPGLYSMIMIDCFMLKRNIEMKKEKRKEI
ncbi:MAG: metallophosphoesterase [Promethearchaeota archaeon]